MIIGTYRTDIEIGKVISGKATDPQCNEHKNVRMLPLREVTFEDYVKYHIENGSKNTEYFFMIDKSKARFYEVSID